MEFDKTIKGRRSIRKYKDKAVPNSVIEEIINLACYAPSSMNGRPWHFIIIKDDTAKKKLVELKNRYCPGEKQMFKADFLLYAPVIIIVCVDKEKSYDREIENGVLATANIMLGAYSRGLGSVYMSAYKDDEPCVSEEIRHIVGIAHNIIPINIIPMGYPDESCEEKELPALKEIVHYDKF